MEIILISGSLRKESVNTKLILLAEKIIKENPLEKEENSFKTEENQFKTKVKTNIIDLNDYILPYYNQDIEDNSGIPSLAKKLNEKISSATGIIISCPEYNYSMPGHLKNTFDWLSRTRPMTLRKKSMLLLSASPSLVGGNRGLWSLRVPFEGLGCFVFPDMFSLANSFEAFNEDGSLKDNTHLKNLNNIVLSFLKFANDVKN